MRRHTHHNETEESHVKAEAAGDQPGAVQEPPDAGEGARAEDVPEDRGAAQLEREMDALHERIRELEKKLAHEQGLHLRALADFQNYRRRADEQRGELVQFANRELVLGLLPILDNLERGLAAAEKTQSYEALVGGVALTLRQLQDYLKKNGVEAIDAIGKEFDPNFHEAVMRVEDAEQPENTVVDEMQKGYTMHSRVLRPTMVKVARSE